jgi:hypothetical protein
MKNGRLIVAALAGVIGAMVSGLPLGCVNANVDSSGWQQVAREYKDAYAGGDTDQDRAVQSAREAAIEAGLTKDQLSDYAVSVDSREKYRWVEFRKRGSKGETWPAHFVVRVDPAGKTIVYKNPAAATGR